MNYVWINKETSILKRPATCSVSLKHIDEAHKNAYRYPDAAIDIWVDYDLLDNHSEQVLHQHHEKYAPSNVRLCDLSDIPQYKKYADIFREHSCIGGRMHYKKMYPIWSRVDIARLIVLKHSLKNTPETNCFYADFDVPDLKIKEATDILSTHSIALGSTITLENLVFKNKHQIENGYIAFKKDRDGRKALHRLLAMTLAHGGVNGYAAFLSFVDRLKEENTFPINDIIVKRVLFQQGYTIPDKKNYKEFDLN